jgi:CubicO group peptidase (beta-lactamase class C family)
MTATVWDEAAVPKERLAVGYKRKADGTLEAVRHWRLGAFEAAGGIYSSVRDLARYAAFQLDATPPRDAPESPVLRRSSVREAQASENGLAWQRSRGCRYAHLVWHNGGTEAYRSALYLLPDEGVAAIALIASDGDADELAQGALDLLRRDGLLAPRRPPPRAEVIALAERVMANLRAWDEPSFAALKFGLPIAGVRELFDRVRTELGACNLGPLLDSGGRHDGAWRLSCERGPAFEVYIAGTPGAQPRLQALWLGPEKSRAPADCK